MVMVAYFCNRKSTVPGWPNLRRHIECLIQKKWETIIYKIPIKNYILYEQKVVASTFLVLQLFINRGPHVSTCKDKSVPGRTTIEILGSRLIRVSLVLPPGAVLYLLLVEAPTKVLGSTFCSYDCSHQISDEREMIFC